MKAYRVERPRQRISGGLVAVQCLECNVKLRRMIHLGKVRQQEFRLRERLAERFLTRTRTHLVTDSSVQRPFLPPPRWTCNCRCLSVSNSAQKHFQTDLHQILREGRQWANEQMIKFWWRSGSGIRIQISIATLVRCALVEVCTVPVFLDPGESGSADPPRVLLHRFPKRTSWDYWNGVFTGQMSFHHHHHPPHHNHFTALFRHHPGDGTAGARRELQDFVVQGKINRGRHADHLGGCHSIRTRHVGSNNASFTDYIAALRNSDGSFQETAPKKLPRILYNTAMAVVVRW